MAIINNNDKCNQIKVKLTAFDLKLALLEYFRFIRQWVCVDECMDADVIADTGKQIIEVEVKISRQDLLKGEEKKKWKHNWYRDALPNASNVPNKYYFCVPKVLQDIAIEYATSLNPKYGVIIYDHETLSIEVIKSAHILHGNYHSNHRYQIAKRTSAKIITMMQKENARKRIENAGLNNED